MRPCLIAREVMAPAWCSLQRAIVRSEDGGWAGPRPNTNHRAAVPTARSRLRGPVQRQEISRITQSQSWRHAPASQPGPFSLGPPPAVLGLCVWPAASLGLAARFVAFSAREGPIGTPPEACCAFRLAAAIDSRDRVRQSEQSETERERWERALLPVWPANTNYFRGVLCAKYGQALGGLKRTVTTE